MKIDVPYGMTRRLEGVSFPDARKRTVDALATEGFGVLTEIDVQATLEKKLGAKMAPYSILGACNPQLAHRAIQGEPAVGLLLPCNVVVAEDGPDVLVSVASPRAMFSIAAAADASVSAVADEAEERLRRVVDRL